MELEPRPLGQVGQTDELTVSELILGDELREWSIRYCMYLGDGVPCQPARLPFCLGGGGPKAAEPLKVVAPVGGGPALMNFIMPTVATGPPGP